GTTPKGPGRAGAFPGAAFSFLPAPLAMAYSEASRPGVSNDQLSSPRPLYRLNLKINAIGSAVEELAIWGEQRDRPKPPMP
ncbi:TPA: hypothetical protein ACPFJF_003785, partial [Pseudomonas aeruginosa]